LTAPAPTRLSPPYALFAAWSLFATGALAGGATAAFMFGVFNKPHAFGNRDGQGAAGLAAMILLGGVFAFVVCEGLALFFASRLKRRGHRWAYKATLWPAGVALVGSFVLSMVV
jgi:hypothetical protein